MKEWNDTPDEVWEAWTIQCMRFIGMKTYNRLQEIINKYPEYFPWENKFKQIPDSVHEAHDKEWGKRESEIMSQEPPESDSDGLTQLFKRLDFYENQKRRTERERRRIWNKHYKPYKLAFRE